MNTKEQAYCEFINGLQLRHIKGRELISQSRRKNSGGLCGIPKKSLWKNIVPTLQVLDMLRAHFNSPLTINSAYRSPGYNRACGGKSQSYHMSFFAIDFKIKGVSPTQCYNRLTLWRNKGVFKGGLGRYDTFTHVDTRGYNATWG
jgi:uncharacterized protein YcbK (DUF882 family)